jgi:outer membrane protein TolC
VATSDRNCRWLGLALASCLCGCADRSNYSAPTPLADTPAAALPASTAIYSRVSYESPQLIEPAARAADALVAPNELTAQWLVEEVERVNPTLEAASAAWRAAAERYPQAISLDDPMFGFMISPSGVGRDMGGGWMIETSQRLSLYGKRQLRGSAAQAEADAMQGDVGDTRLALTEAARTALLDYYLARRQTEVNATTAELLRQFRQIAKAKYEVGQATEQDVLQADVEQATLESRRTELTRDEQVATARINTLLHRSPDYPLPPPAQVAMPENLPPIETLQEQAQRQRPDLYAMAARIRAEEANLALANKEYYPDPEVALKYDAFMPEEMRPQVGVNLNVPIRLSRRSAAVREAGQRLQQRRAEYESRLDQVRFELRSAYLRAVQGQQAVGLYRDKILPAAERNLDSARANYTAGKIDFLRLIDAARQLSSQRDMYYQALTDYHRRLAELDRASGGSLRPEG